MEKNVYPIVYSNKMKNVIDDVGFTGKFTYLENINDFSPEDVLLNKNVKIKYSKIVPINDIPTFLYCFFIFNHLYFLSYIASK